MSIDRTMLTKYSADSCQSSRADGMIGTLAISPTITSIPTTDMPPAAAPRRKAAPGPCPSYQNSKKTGGKRNQNGSAPKIVIVQVEFYDYQIVRDDYQNHWRYQVYEQIFYP